MKTTLKRGLLNYSERSFISANVAKLALVIMTLVFTFSCSTSIKQSNNLYESNDYYNYLQPTFNDYLTVTKQWLKTNRTYISNNPDKELDMNMPFQLGKRDKAQKAILLVHGLGDSPYSFSDLGHSLVKQGFYVQTLLLPGHGSKPQDLMLPNYSDWQEIVDHYANLLKKEYDNVWLGGYSTGGNLVTIHTIENEGIDGLMLFSPGFQSNVPVIEKFARAVSLFTDGYERRETNLAKYSSSLINGAIAYSDSASKLRSLFEDHQVTIPTLVVISESDSAVDSTAVKNMYLKHFNNAKNKMVWYGNLDKEHDSIQVHSMELENERISTGSHMSSLFSRNNAYYGVMGERRMCVTVFKIPPTRSCKKHTEEIWYASWGYKEEGKTHTRLTWNPYYSQMENEMIRIAR